MWPLSALGRITGYRFCGSQSAGTLAGVLDILMSEVVEYRGRRSGACTPRRLSPNASLAVQPPTGFPTQSTVSATATPASNGRTPGFSRSPLSTSPGGISSRRWPQCSPPSPAACSGLRPEPDCRPRRTYLHLSYGCASPFGPAILVTQDPNRTISRKGVGSPTHPSGTPALRMPSMMRSRWAR